MISVYNTNGKLKKQITKQIKKPKKPQLIKIIKTTSKEIKIVFLKNYVERMMTLMNHTYYFKLYGLNAFMYTHQSVSASERADT